MHGLVNVFTVFNLYSIIYLQYFSLCFYNHFSWITAKPTESHDTTTPRQGEFSEGSFYFCTKIYLKDTHWNHLPDNSSEYLKILALVGAD